MKFRKKLKKVDYAILLAEAVAFSLGGCFLVALYVTVIFMINR